MTMENYFSHIEVQNQYRDTNIEELLQGIKAIYEKYVIGAREAYDECIDLRVCRGDALDMWGRLLNFSRYIRVSEEAHTLFKDFTFYNRNFVKLKFYDASDITYSRLTDSAYRLVLQLLWSSRNIQSTLPNVGEIASEIFNTKVSVGDSMDMRYVTYYFKEEIPPWLSYILTNYDILPRPACVNAKFVSAISRIFGFRTDDSEYNKKLASFWHARFADDPPMPADFTDNIINALDKDIDLDYLQTNENEFREFYGKHI